MTRGQRWLLGAVGCLIVVVGIAAAAAGSDGDRRSSTEVGSRPRSDAGGGAPSTDTTLPLVPVTGGAPLPPVSTTPPSVPMPTPEQIAAAVPPAEASAGRAAVPASPALGPEGAALVRPAQDELRPIDKAKGCTSALDRGWRMVDCGALRRDDGVLLWTVQARGRGLRATVLREQTAGSWLTVLRADDEAGERWSKIGVRGDDVSGDGRPDLVFGFHGRDGASSLGVDVVDGPGSVVLHRLLPAGSVRTSVGAIETWARLGDGSFEHATLRRLAGSWKVASSERVAATAVPPSIV